MAKLASPHPMALQTAFSDLKQQAFEQPFLFVGTPGSISKRTVNGGTFLYRQYYDPTGKKAADYIGAAGDIAAEARAKEIQDQIGVANALLGTARLLASGGYARTDARTDAILAAMANNELFQAGAVL